MLDDRLRAGTRGVSTHAMAVAEEKAIYHGPLPDILAYLQNETELTHATVARILKESGRLRDFLVNPQRFMDEVAHRLKFELHRLLVDGIKYERLAGPRAEWEMRLLENKELVDYLSALEVQKSIYDYRRLRLGNRAGVRQAARCARRYQAVRQAASLVCRRYAGWRVQP